MKRMNSLSGHKGVTSVISWFMFLLSVLWLMPIAFAVLNSFKNMGAVITTPLALPTSFYVENYKTVWKQIDYLSLFTNSTIVLIASELCLVVLCSMGGFWLQRNSHIKAVRLFTNYFLLSLFIPFQAIMVSLIALFSSTQLTQNHSGIIIANIGLSASMAIFLYFGYSQQIPKELDEAAAVDGASPFQTYFRIIFPLMTPMTSTVLILTSLSVWNDYLKPVLLIQNKDYFTLTVGTARVIYGEYFTRYNLAVTALVMAAIPMLIVFIFLQKRIVSGVVSGAVKG